MIPADAPPLVLALAPYSLDEVQTSATVTYSFLGAGVTIDTTDINGEDSISRAWSAQQQQFVHDTFAYLETIVALDFVAVDSATPDIEFVQVDFLLQDTTGASSLLVSGVTEILLPTVSIDFDDVTIIHEIGHAIGLSHPFDGPNTIPGSGDFDPGPLGLNNELVSRMSYSPAQDTLIADLQINGTPFALGAADIAALHFLYGANTSTGAGDTTYTVTPGRLETIWDTGGFDRIDFSAATEAVIVDLRPATLELEAGGGGYLSAILSDGIANGGFTIANGVEIEAAIGGSGDDGIIGNALDNQLAGGEGNDSIEGGAGTDTAVYTGNQSSYTLTLSAQGDSITDRRGFQGEDQISNIEALSFLDDTGDAFNLAIFGGTQNLTATEMRSFIELYIAYFDRAPDAVGLNFWGTTFANGTSLERMAELFNPQAETQAAYPEGTTNQQFVTAIYNNVFGRDPDSDGSTFWVGQLNDGAARDSFILSVLRGARNDLDPTVFGQEVIDQQLADRAFLDAKTDIGTYFAVTRGMSDLDNARTAMNAFDGSAGSISSAVSAIDSYFAAAQDAVFGEFLMPLVGVLDDPFAGLA